jgi:2-keto-4-pentenoate hydratase
MFSEVRRKALSRSGCIVIAGLILFMWTAATAAADDKANAVVNAYSLVIPVPNPGSAIGTSTAKAYQFQSQVVEGLKGRWGEVIGYKGGLTSPQAQKRFGLSSPVYGVRFAAGVHKSGSVINRADFIRPFLETEIGFIMKKTITKPVANTKALKKMIAGVCPVFELPDLAFADMKNITAADIIGTNVGARMIVKGKVKPLSALSKVADPIVVKHNNQVYVDGKPTDAMGSQMEALKWVINEVVKNGGSVKKGNLIITGALGGMKPMKPGKYVANYGGLGTLSFTAE